ncbi:hypothetical protein F5148DRAFT_599245 [Russula earlei]|uniref:Uncharacterized protein n=1 Tax=Russula earlei TaxID=71964 RepID=A0ACC0UFD3_9AGAM|nr:hypothetical protein F5148DRAFT_599245 [Russula earlei]
MTVSGTPRSTRVMLLIQPARVFNINRVATPTLYHITLGMSHLTRPTPPFWPVDSKAIGQGPPRRDILRWSAPPIHILDHDSLLNIFSLSRPVLVDDAEADSDHILDGGEWGRERWWYKLVHVCQRWRNLILGSASYLQLCLVCTYGVPVADMLAHSPRLPLIIDYINVNRDITEDEGRILLALQHRDRVRRIRLEMSISNLQKLIVAIEDDFPVLEFLYVGPPSRQDTSLTLSKSLRAPHLRHLILRNFAFPTGSPLLATPGALVTLSLQCIHPPTSFRSNELLQRLSLMPQLETLGIQFHSYYTSSHVERDLLDVPITTHATLPNLRWFGFGGASAYLEALLPRITLPLLEKLQLNFPHEPTFSVSNLLQFMSTARNLRLNSIKFNFDDSGIEVTAYPHEGAKMYSFLMDIGCRYLELQVFSLAQIFDDLSPAFSTVEHLTLTYTQNDPSPEDYTEAEPSQWRKLLGSFRNLKTLVVANGLVGELSRCLRLDDGGLPLELLPDLKELSWVPGMDPLDS